MPNQSVELARGFQGLRAMYMRVLNELSDGEGYSIFAISPNELLPATDDFLREFHTLRTQRGISIRIIGTPRVLHNHYQKEVLGDLVDARMHSSPFPIGCVIGKNRVLFLNFREKKTAIEIVSVEMASQFNAFFELVWSGSDSF